ncbi:phosphatase PAP2 family protein [Flavobacterium sp. SM15]|uniref:phosphatase PAP2 family protein n=1 Tax=Flavobacterium sp. SM15 TaxID=2908005 RepID=UPI001ED9E816|nr:phosphatase PAP2 family protein [Flavobacterium sp. SM15]MCG2611465.1 phosphatase PAP2 family protein [Flavobacterium sp. SM15]
MKLKHHLIWIIALMTSLQAVAQNAIDKDSVSVKSEVLVSENLKFNYKQLIIPTVLISYGIIAFDNNELLGLNTQIKAEVAEHIDEKITIDDFSQYVPATSVYLLNNLGVKGKNNLKDRSIIIGTSYLIVAVSVTGLKHATKVERPDGSSFNSFPSGHTATAFAGAEFLWQEYKDTSCFYGIAGYLVASGTGLYRMLNNRHWLTDVAAGAGIGILSTKIAYWTFPYINKVFVKKQTKTSVGMLPFYNGKQIGLATVISLN